MLQKYMRSIFPSFFDGSFISVKFWLGKKSSGKYCMQHFDVTARDDNATLWQLYINLLPEGFFTEGFFNVTALQL